MEILVFKIPKNISQLVNKVHNGIYSSQPHILTGNSYSYMYTDMLGGAIVPSSKLVGATVLIYYFKVVLFYWK